MTDKELNEIEGRCRSATPGPWKSYIEGRDHLSGSNFIMAGDSNIEMCGASHADQDFIAAARQDVPALIAEIRRLQKALD